MKHTDMEAKPDCKVSHQFFSSGKDVIATLEKEWLQLEKQARTNGFLSWRWIGTWLERVELPLVVVKAEHQGRLAGVALFCLRVHKKFGFIPVRQFWLNRTGDDKQDQTWIEYNDCLLMRDGESVIRQSIYDYLFAQTDLFDELYIGLSLDSAIPLLIPTKFGRRQLITSIGFSNDIADCTLDQLLAQFSKNTRRQVKRSIKLLSEQGELKIRAAKDEIERLSWFEQVASLHRQKWRDSDWGSGFDNPLFVDFHNQLLCQQSEHYELLALMLDEKPLCFLYNMCSGKEVYFYLSAIPEQVDNRIKFGLVAHTLAMAYYSAQGYARYDFLAGESRYKDSLSDHSYVMKFGCFYRWSLLARLEEKLRCYKKALVGC